MPPAAVRDHDRLTRCLCGHFKTEHKAAPGRPAERLWCTAALVRVRLDDAPDPITCACLDFTPADSVAAEIIFRNPVIR